MRRFLKPGTLLGVIAVLIATTGTAVAGSLITSKNIKDGTIKSRDISKNAITGDRLAGDVRAELSKSGQAGPQGTKGDTGAAGAKGADGVAGAKGDKGVTGAQGPKGDKGDKGDKGENGADGATGAQGDKGADGATGAKGADGATGAKGDTGAQGPQGEKGDKGADGAKGETGPQGARGADGDDGVDGVDGVDGQDGAVGPQGPQGEQGANGANGKDGRDGVRWERVTGTCVTTGDLTKGEVMVNDGALKLGLAAIKGPYAQFKMLVENVTLADVSKLSFAVKLEGSSNSYMKLQLEGNRFIVFQPGAQTVMPSSEWTTYNVAAADGKLRDNNDSGTTPTFSLAELQATQGDLIVKSLEITAGCAGGANNGAVLVDDVTLNDTVIDFD